MQKLQPSPALRPLVESLWAIDGAASPRPSRTGRERVLATGSMHIAFRLGDLGFRFFASPEDAAGHSIGRAVVGGARCGSYLKEVPAAASSVGVRLRPGAAELLFGMPAQELAGRHTRLDDLWGRGAVVEMRQRLAAEPDAERRLRRLEALLLARLPTVLGVHPAVAHGLARFESAAGVGAVVAETGYSHRRFIALFRRAVGLAPKRYCRMRRFRRVLLRLAEEPGISSSELALDAGYSDQAHFSREFRRLSELTPGEYRRSLRPRPGHVTLEPVRPG